MEILPDLARAQVSTSTKLLIGRVPIATPVAQLQFPDAPLSIMVPPLPQRMKLFVHPIPPLGPLQREQEHITWPLVLPKCRTFARNSLAAAMLPLLVFPMAASPPHPYLLGPPTPTPPTAMVPIPPANTNLFAMAKGKDMGIRQLIVTDDPYIRGTPKLRVILETPSFVMRPLTAAGRPNPLTTRPTLATTLFVNRLRWELRFIIPLPLHRAPKAMEPRITEVPAGTPAKKINGRCLANIFAFLCIPSDPLPNML